MNARVIDGRNSDEQALLQANLIIIHSISAIIRILDWTVCVRI